MLGSVDMANTRKKVKLKLKHKTAAHGVYLERKRFVAYTNLPGLRALSINKTKHISSHLLFIRNYTNSNWPRGAFELTNLINEKKNLLDPTATTTSNSAEQKLSKLNVYSDKASMVFGSYLAGLFEGDGHIWIPGDAYGLRHNPRFHITFHIKDKPLAIHLQKTLGYGFIRIKTSNNAVVLTVSPIKGLILIMNLMSPFLRTPKIIQVELLRVWIWKHKINSLPKNLESILEISQLPMEKDSWLAGFLDADGSFAIRQTLKASQVKRTTHSVSLCLDQRKLDPISGESYEHVLNLIAKSLALSLISYNQKSTGRSYYRIRGSSKASINAIINYLDCYNLHSTKLADYNDWKQVGLIILNNIDHKPYSCQEISRIRLIKNGMNTKRKPLLLISDWDHLKTLSLI
jgi:hypothetical protein